MRFFTGLVTGFALGGIFGVFIMAVCIASKDSNYDSKYH